MNRRLTFVRWVRKTHGWFGLWGALLGLMMALLAVGSNAQPVLRKVVIESPATAVCLDGTQPAVFVKPGDPANWVFYMQGGALCTVSVSFIFITRA